MNVIKRNNVRVSGKGNDTIMFAHGFGCDQNMWRFVAPQFEDAYQTILFDHVGAGQSDLNAFDYDKYSILDGYADDIIAIVQELNLKNIIFVGHSVSAMMGIIAANKSPELFKSLILVSPSPCYINDHNYIGGFTKSEVEELLDALAKNHLGWSMAMAPVIMGNPDREELGLELADSFCRTDPTIAAHFARTTFLTDSRDIINSIDIPTMILQCDNDIIAPIEVGQYMQQNMKDSKLVYLEATGHCPNLSAPAQTVAAIKEFLAHESK